eukprot:COSAG02_NODE_869_length_16359_cov_49.339176_11_plen_105_part_00
MPPTHLLLVGQAIRIHRQTTPQQHRTPRREERLRELHTPTPSDAQRPGATSRTERQQHAQRSPAGRSGSPAPTAVRTEILNGFPADVHTQGQPELVKMTVGDHQ